MVEGVESSSFRCMETIMATPFLGEILIVGFNFAPPGYAFCDGQLLPINQNTALFSLLGTTYGGDGVQTFALPNLQSRIPLHFGQGSGLTPYNEGDTAGAEAVTLTPAQLPTHTHPLQGTTNLASSRDPGGNVLAVTQHTIYDNSAATPMAAGTVGANPTSNFPHDNLQPYLAVNFIIALQGIFPSRS
jgi:microcystin-dependent protein